MDVTQCLRTVLLVSSRVLGRPVERGQGFFAVGGDSLLAVELLIALEVELDVEIDEDAVFTTATFGELAEHIASAGVGAR